MVCAVTCHKRGKNVFQIEKQVFANTFIYTKIIVEDDREDVGEYLLFQGGNSKHLDNCTLFRDFLEIIAKNDKLIDQM